MAAKDWITDLVYGPPQGYFVNHSTPVPKDGYRRAILQFKITQAPAPMPSAITDAAAQRGWRVLKVQYTEPFPEVPAMEGYHNYTAYVQPDFKAENVGSLRTATGAYTVVIEKQTASLAESAALDALWVSRGSAKDIVGEKPVGVAVDLPIKEIVIGGTVLLGLGYLLFRKKKRRKR